MERREAKQAKAAEISGTPFVPLADRPDATFIPSLLDEFLEVIIDAMLELSVSLQPIGPLCTATVFEYIEASDLLNSSDALMPSFTIS